MGKMAIDLNRGVSIRGCDKPTCFQVFMYKDEPGVYLNVYGNPVSDEIAEEAGFNVKELGKAKALKERMAAVFRTKTRDEWCELMEGTDVCFAPVLSLREAPSHPHNVHRGTFLEMGGVVQPAPAPRFSRTPASVDRPSAHPGQHTDEALTDWGFAAAEVAKLRETEAVR